MPEVRILSPRPSVYVFGEDARANGPRTVNPATSVMVSLSLTLFTKDAPETGHECGRSSVVERRDVAPAARIRFPPVTPSEGGAPVAGAP